jgi:hypothetical protein
MLPLIQMAVGKSKEKATPELPLEQILRKKQLISLETYQEARNLNWLSTEQMEEYVLRIATVMIHFHLEVNKTRR